MSNSEHLNRLRNSCLNAQISRFLNREIEIPGPGQCTVRIPFHPELTQNSEFVHGALFFEIADTAGFIAANSMETTYSVLTIEFNINFLRPVKNSGIQATAKVIHKGKSIIICNSSVFDAAGKLVAEGRGTYFISEILLSSIKSYAEI